MKPEALWNMHIMTCMLETSQELMSLLKEEEWNIANISITLETSQVPMCLLKEEAFLVTVHPHWKTN